MQSHFVLLAVFAVFVSLVFALLSEEDDPRAQLRFGGALFAGFLVAAIVFGWLMYPFPL